MVHDNWVVFYIISINLSAFTLHNLSYEVVHKLQEYPHNDTTHNSVIFFQLGSDFLSSVSYRCTHNSVLCCDTWSCFMYICTCSVFFKCAIQINSWYQVLFWAWQNSFWIMTCYEQPVGNMVYQKHKYISNFQDSERTSVICQEHIGVEWGLWYKSSLLAAASLIFWEPRVPAVCSIGRVHVSTSERCEEVAI